jgi:NADPH:quinone reductase-like Zn-dependent oxidoreductase
LGIKSEGRCAEWQEPSGPSGVRIVERPKTPLEDAEVAVAIRCASLNHIDLFTAQGIQPVKPPIVICADGAGVVEESRDPRWKAGDEVVLFPTLSDGTCDACQDGQEVYCRNFGILGEHSDGTACERLVMPGRMLYRKPPALSWEEAAAFPLTFLTAWRMLTTRARLERGETLLVVGAGAGVSVAAIALGVHLGARVLVTSRSEDKVGRAREMGAEAGFPSTDFSGAVRDATGKAGADVIFDSVGAATIDEDLKCLRLGGRIVSCGSTSGPKVTILWPRLFFRHADLLGSTMGNSGEFESLLQTFDEGVRPVVDSVHPLAEVQAAMERLDRAEQFGKVVLNVSK